MNPDRWKRAKELFTQARELSESERESYLVEVASAEAGLVEEVLELLRLHDKSPPRFLEPFNLGRGELPDLELLEEIGSGGMGVVYLARQRSLDRTVAVKVLRQQPGIAEDDVRAFRSEAARAAQLQHPGIVTIHAIGSTDEPPYFVMEYINGKSLRELLADARSLPRENGWPRLELKIGAPKQSYPARVAELIAFVADALQFLHDRRMIHRDIKPSNILVDQNGKPKLVDFGIAKDVSHETLSQRIVGTPYYMSPEQARLRSIRIDHRTDVYSLGVVAYELLSLVRPFDG